jgi:hypothetical protein
MSSMRPLVAVPSEAQGAREVHVWNVVCDVADDRDAVAATDSLPPVVFVGRALPVQIFAS